MTRTSLQSQVQVNGSKVPSLHELRADQLEVARLAHEDLGKRLARRLASDLRLPVEISLLHLKSENLSALFGRLCAPSTTAAISLQPGSTALIILNNSVCLSMIERMLGGSAMGPHSSDHLSSVELKILRSVLDQLMGELSSQWLSSDSTRLAISRVFPTPEVASKEGGNGQHLVFSYTLCVGGLESAMQIALPFAALLKFLDRCTSAETPTESTLKSDLLEDMAAPLLATAVDVEVLLDGGTIRLGTLSQLVPGSLLLLDIGLETQAEAVINGTVRLRGRVVRQDTKRLFRFSAAQNLV